MPRRIEDIIPNNRRSIRDIPLRKDAKKIVEKSSAQKVDHIHLSKVKNDKDEPLSPNKISLDAGVTRSGPRSLSDRKRGTPTGLRWLLLTVGVIIVFAGVGYVVTIFFARASFTIVPKSVPVPVDGVFATIPYELLTLTGSASTTVPSSIGSSVYTKAQGPVVFYNIFSNQTQKLVAGTRVTNTSGKIYRLSSSIVIPGYTLSSSKTIMPGSIKATLVADQAGDSYNITGEGSVSDFKVVAYKGSTKYDTIYARQTDSIVGGFAGNKRVVDLKVIASSTVSLQSAIVSSLWEKASSTAPTGYLVYKNAYTTSFGKPTSEPSGTTTTSIVTLKGTANFLMFKENNLVNNLATGTTTATFGTFPYYTEGLDSLSVQVIGTSTGLTKLSLRIKGSFKLIGSISIDSFKKKMLGKTSAEAQKVIEQYSPVIDSVSGDVMPQWAQIPNDIGRIDVKLSR